MSTEITKFGFSDRLKAIRKELSLTQKEFAEKLNIPVSTYQHYERGESEAPISLIPKLTLFGFSVMWLLSGKGSPYIREDHKKPATIPQQETDSIEIRQISLLERFEDKQCALNIYRALIELESLHPETFKRIEFYIKGTVDMIRDVVGKLPQKDFDRRRENRRVNNDPSKIPAGIERRSGEDRRKAG